VEDFEQRRRALVLADPEPRLQAEDDRQKQWKTEQVIEVVLEKRAANVVRAEHPPSDEVQQHRAEADGIAVISKRARRRRLGRSHRFMLPKAAAMLEWFSVHC
jgi:hypothetical protein